MSYNKEQAIAAQNAGTTAATIYNATVGVFDGPFDGAKYDEIRLHVYNGTLRLAGLGGVIEKFETPTDVVRDVQSEQAPLRPANPPPPRPAGGTGRGPGGGMDPGTLEIRSGKHAGKTIADVFDADPDYLTWAAENLRNDFLKSKIVQFLSAA